MNYSLFHIKQQLGLYQIQLIVGEIDTIPR